jgi:hypothetical protein
MVQAQSTITHKQMMAAMAAAVEPFSLRYIKLNEQKGTGGEVVALSGQLLSSKGMSESAPTIGAAPVDVEELETWLRRNPNHYENMTRNLKSTVNGRYTKVHIYLITEFEGKKVII